MTWNHTNHSDQRCVERNLSDSDLDYVFRHGRIMYNAGAKIYFLGARDIPRADRRDQRVSQLVGVTVVTCEDSGEEVIITVYRHKQGFRHFRKKTKRELRKSATGQEGKVDFMEGFEALQGAAG